MRRIFIGIVFGISCTSQPKQNTAADVLREDTSTTIGYTESQESDYVEDQDSVVLSQLPTSGGDDYFAFVGFINCGTSESYITLHPRHLPLDFEVTELFDSTLEEEGNYRRVRLKLDSVKNYFDLTNLDTLLLFDGSNKFKKMATFGWAELKEDMGREQFLAVYNNSYCDLERRPYYVVSPNVVRFIRTGLTSHIVNDLLLDETIVKDLKLDETKMEVSMHRQMSPSGQVYSAVIYGDKSYIVETDHGRCRILIEQTDGYNFYYLLPIPILVKEKPLLLVTISNPNDPEMHGDEYLLVFDGEGYTYADANRIPVSEFQQ